MYKPSQEAAERWKAYRDRTYPVKKLAQISKQIEALNEEAAKVKAEWADDPETLTEWEKYNGSKPYRP